MILWLYSDEDVYHVDLKNAVDKMLSSRGNIFLAEQSTEFEVDNGYITIAKGRVAVAYSENEKGEKSTQVNPLSIIKHGILKNQDYETKYTAHYRAGVAMQSRQYYYEVDMVDYNHHEFHFGTVTRDGEQVYFGFPGVQDKQDICMWEPKGKKFKKEEELWRFKKDEKDHHGRQVLWMHFNSGVFKKINVSVRNHKLTIRPDSQYRRDIEASIAFIVSAYMYRSLVSCLGDWDHNITKKICN